MRLYFNLLIVAEAVRHGDEEHIAVGRLNGVQLGFQVGMLVRDLGELFVELGEFKGRQGPATIVEAEAVPVHGPRHWVLAFVPVLAHSHFVLLERRTDQGNYGLTNAPVVFFGNALEAFVAGVVEMTGEILEGRIALENSSLFNGKETGSGNNGLVHLVLLFFTLLLDLSSVFH